MNIVLLQTQLHPREINLLLKEFPNYLFLSLSEAACRELPEEQWSQVEILFGSHLSEEELLLAKQLNWIHTPSAQLSRLCLDKLFQRDELLVSYTIDENTFQIAEFVLAAILAFSKNLFHWNEINKSPRMVWNSKWRDSMWTLGDKVLLQIGLGKDGSEIAKRGLQSGMKVWGVQSKQTFHPHCHKVFSRTDLNEILPLADVVCFCPPRGKEYFSWIQKEQLEKMKEDAILIILGPSDLVKDEALAEAAEKKRFRGIVLDALYQAPLHAQSPLWGLPNVIVTPEIAPRPKSEKRTGFRLFLYNLRQYSHGNFKDMRNIVNKESIPS